MIFIKLLFLLFFYHFQSQYQPASHLRLLLLLFIYHSFNLFYTLFSLPFNLFPFFFFFKLSNSFLSESSSVFPLGPSSSLSFPLSSLPLSLSSLIRDPIPENMLYFAVLPVKTLSIWNSFSSLSAFHLLDGFERVGALDSCRRVFNGVHVTYSHDWTQAMSC